MNIAPVPSAAAAFFELRFEPLFQPGLVLAFPCDGEGHVDLARCTFDERTSYLFARAMVGREYKGPRVAPVLSRAVEVQAILSTTLPRT